MRELVLISMLIMICKDTVYKSSHDFLHVADLVDWQFKADDFHVHHVVDLVDWQFNAADFHVYHVADLIDWRFNAEHMRVGEQSI